MNAIEEQTASKGDCSHITNDGKYGVKRGTGELWRLGKHGYMAGYVMDPENIEHAARDEADELACLPTCKRCGSPDVAAPYMVNLATGEAEAIDTDCEETMTGELICATCNSPHPWCNRCDDICELSQRLIGETR